MFHTLLEYLLHHIFPARFLQQKLFLVYYLRIIPLIFLESFKAYLAVQHQSKYLRYEGVVGICIRIPIILVFYYAGFGIFTFPLAMTIDFTVRAAYFGWCSVKVHKRINNGELTIVR